MYVGAPCCRWRSTATYSSATTIPPFRLLQGDYPSTILGKQYDSADPFDDCDCADALLQIRGHPLMIPRTLFDDSVDILDDAAKKLQITNEDNPQISYQAHLLALGSFLEPC